MIDMQPYSHFEDFMRYMKFKMASRLVGQGDRILDVGGGTGDVWDHYMGPRGGIDPFKPEINLIEPNDKYRDIVVSKGICNLVFTNMDHSIIKVSEYDLVTIFGVLEHVDEPQHFLSDYYGAERILVTVPNAYSFHRVVGVEMGLLENVHELGPSDLAIGHKRVYEAKTLMLELRKMFQPPEYLISCWSFGFKPSASKDMDHFSYEQLEAMDRALGHYGIDAGAELVAEVKRCEF